MPALLERPASRALLDAHAALGDLCDFHRAKGDWREHTGELAYIAAPASAAFGFITPGTLAMLIAEDDEPLLDRFADAATRDDAGLMTEVAQHLGARVDGAASRTAEITLEATRAVGDIAYAGQIVARNIVVDSLLRFNFVALEYHGGELDARAFTLRSFATQPEARPLRAVIVARPAVLSDIEAAAMQQVPAAERGAKIYLGTRKALIQDVGNRVREIAANRRNLANDLDVDRLADRVADKLVQRLAADKDFAKNIGRAVGNRDLEIDAPAARKAVVAVERVPAALRNRALDRDLDVDRANVGRAAKNLDRANLDRAKLDRIANRAGLANDLGPLKRKGDAVRTSDEVLALMGSEPTVSELLELRNSLLAEQP